jgi:glycosyltransferase involved in cell wall biosynthesis
MPDFTFLNFKKCIFISHGFPENKAVINYPTHYMYGTTSDSILDLFPKNIPIMYTPNGVDPDNFYYQKRSGEIKTLGWAGASYQVYKHLDWGKQIAEGTALSLEIAEHLPFHEMKHWYHKIDVLLITAIPEEWRETGPLPAFEAIVSGVLVVGSAVGNFRKIPGPKYSSVEDGIAIVNELKTNPEKVRQLAEEQYECVMNNWTYKQLSHYWRTAFYATMR